MAAGRTPQGGVSFPEFSVFFTQGFFFPSGRESVRPDPGEKEEVLKVQTELSWLQPYPWIVGFGSEARRVLVSEPCRHEPGAFI